MLLFCLQCLSSFTYFFTRFFIFWNKVKNGKITEKVGKLGKQFTIHPYILYLYFLMAYLFFYLLQRFFSYMCIWLFLFWEVFWENVSIFVPTQCKSIWAEEQSFLIIFFRIEERKSFMFEITWAWINDERSKIFGWTLPLKTYIHCSFTENLLVLHHARKVKTDYFPLCIHLFFFPFHCCHSHAYLPLSLPLSGPVTLYIKQSSFPSPAALNVHHSLRLTALLLMSVLLPSWLQVQSSVPNEISQICNPPGLTLSSPQIHLSYHLSHLLLCRFSKM